MKPLNANVAVDRCSYLSETTSDVSLLDETLSETLSLLFDERTLDEISWLDRHSSLVIIILFKSSWSTTIKDKIILCESDKLQASLVRFPTHLVYDVETPHEDPFHTLSVRTLILQYLKVKFYWGNWRKQLQGVTTSHHDHWSYHGNVAPPAKALPYHHPMKMIIFTSPHDWTSACRSFPVVQHGHYGRPSQRSHCHSSQIRSPYDDCILLFS